MSIQGSKRWCFYYYLVVFVTVFIGDVVVSLSSPSNNDSSRKVAVIGTTGQLGRTVISQLSSQNVPVRCLLRHPIASLKTIDEITEESTSLEVASYLSSLDGVEMVEGDVTDVESLKLLFQGCTEVISVHGASKPKNILPTLFPFLTSEDDDSTHSKQINYVGVQNIVQASAATTIRRIVRITGNNEKPFSFFSILLNMLGKMAKGWNYEGEQVLRTSSTIPYTIIRPGVMRPSIPSTSKSRALGDNGTSNLKVSAVSYAQIAELCIECLDYDNCDKSTLVAMNVGEGEGEDTYAPLLEKVQPDNRHYPTSLIDKHKQGARLGAAILATFLAILLNGFVSLLFKLVSLFH